MIHRLLLQNWRSFERLDLSFESGTTFVVAPNGVGKSSLVLGLAWAVFGDHSNVDSKSCIRAGADQAEARVDMDLPDQRRLVISRVARRRGGDRSTYSIDGTTLSEQSARVQMEAALGVDLPLAGRLSMMLGGGHLAAQDELNLEAHLHHAFGVSHLLEVARTAETLAKEADRARAAFRSSSKKQLANRSELEDEIAELEAEMKRLVERGAELQQLRDSADAQRSLVERHHAIAEQIQRHEQRRSELIAQAWRVLDSETVADDVEAACSALHEELAKIEQSVSDATEGIAAARVAMESAREAVGLLAADAAVCPTCMRPLAAEELASARVAHETRELEARVQIQNLDAVRQYGRPRVRSVAGLLSQLESLEPPVAEPDALDTSDRSQTETLYREASVALDEHNQRIGAVRSRLESLQRQVASDEQLQQEERELQLVYRKEALAIAGARVLREAADQVIESRIEPIAREVRWRWKRLFADDGLTLRADGSIVRVHAAEELGWDTLSGGERTWARIVTHLLVLATTTSLPFAWFDEPLEHLDPQFRRTVAATLAKATVGGAPRQLLVTTYEHSLARQLAEDTDSADIIAIRAPHGRHTPDPDQASVQPMKRAS